MTSRFIGTGLGMSMDSRVLLVVLRILPFLRTAGRLRVVIIDAVVLGMVVSVLVVVGVVVVGVVVLGVVVVGVVVDGFVLGGLVSGGTVITTVVVMGGLVKDFCFNSRIFINELKRSLRAFLLACAGRDVVLDAVVTIVLKILIKQNITA